MLIPTEIYQAVLRDVQKSMRVGTVAPVRIQRKRVKGFNLQAESLKRNGLPCVYVGRPTKWGNPFSHTQRFYGVDNSLALYRSLVQGVWQPALVDHHHIPTIAYAAHFNWLKRLGQHPLEAIRELRGHNLSCFCAEDALCHADILLELALEKEGMTETLDA